MSKNMSFLYFAPLTQFDHRLQRPFGVPRDIKSTMECQEHSPRKIPENSHTILVNISIFQQYTDHNT